MTTSASGPRDVPGDDEVVHDEFIDSVEASDSHALRNLFDLRIIIGGLFSLYGVYLTIYGIFDGAAAVERAAGVRINLWTGLALLAMGLGFLLWAKLRPLTTREIVEATAEEDDADFLSEELRAHRGHAGTGGH
jgi:hypothetical protein